MASGIATDSVQSPSSVLMTTSATPTPTNVTIETSALSRPFSMSDFELVDVGRHPGHDSTGHLALVVVERKALQLRPDPDAERQHDPLRGAPGDKRLGDLVDEIDERDEQEHAGSGEEDE